MIEEVHVSENVQILIELIRLTDEFHTVNHLIPDGQDILSVTTDMLVTEALDIMREKHFSQLPVVSGVNVIGVFS